MNKTIVLILDTGSLTWNDTRIFDDRDKPEAQPHDDMPRKWMLFDHSWPKSRSWAILNIVKWNRDNDPSLRYPNFTHTCHSQVHRKWFAQALWVCPMFRPISMICISLVKFLFWSVKSDSLWFCGSDFTGSIPVAHCILSFSLMKSLIVATYSTNSH
jgi:hypothetical protein